jgi:hypothetical protein
MGTWINQLPASAMRWQHQAHMCFATFIFSTNHKIDNILTTTEVKEK